MVNSRMDLTVFDIAILMASGGVIGVLMGATSIGGVLLVPLVAVICDLPAKAVIPVGMVVALSSALTASHAFARQGQIPGAAARAMLAPAAIGAVAGAFAMAHLPDRVFSLAIVAICVLGVFNGLRRRDVQGADCESSPRVTAAVAGVVGLGSSLSGTSGPVLFVPPYMMLGNAARPTIGLAQVIQLPITIFASLGFAVSGAIDYGLVCILAPAVMCGASMGARFAQRIPADALHHVMTLVLLVAGGLAALG